MFPIVCLPLAPNLYVFGVPWLLSLLGRCAMCRGCVLGAAATVSIPPCDPLLCAAVYLCLLAALETGI